ncbi:MAG: 6-phosphogluconolactonase [Candidatus Polarisedimenticolia bacterium]
MSPMPQSPPLKEDPLRIEICGDVVDLARHAAGLFVSLAGRSLGARRQFAVALSGGSTPRSLYEMLREPQLAFQIVWPAVQVFFSDERCVPPDHEASNYRMVREAFLAHVPIPPDNVHRMAAEDPDPSRAAAACESALRETMDRGTPRLDLVLLGMGEDGHTASLFPGGPEVEETSRLVTPSVAPDGMSRLTMTLPLINAARVVAILVAGESKAGTLRRVLGADAHDEGLPVQRVRPHDGQLIWIVDREAASLLH